MLYTARMCATNPVNFSNQLKELSVLVRQLEGDNVSLEQSVELFEKGVTLAKDCQKQLQKAEQKIQQLVESDGKQQLQDFQTDVD